MKNKNYNRNFHRQSVVIVEQESVPERRRVSSSELFGAQNEIVIDHHDDEYRLRITSNGKLILTK
ncbi:hemin uptake protein HemP [Methylobacter sp.]|jgi:hemin uptake protein HemP|uniref:hemin uptake protein HemP n=1 Tax=Methylobacter sp. TaxID=2051955 RepID=UPI003DA60CF8